MHGRHCMRMQRGATFEQTVHGLPAWVVTPGIVERDQQTLAFCLRQHR